jgi:LacI family transcriptional regulator
LSRKIPFPFFPEANKGFLDRSRPLNYDAILTDTNYDPRRTQEAASRMITHNVSGVAIITSEISRRLIAEFARRKIAVTFLDQGPARDYVSTLQIDYASGIAQVVRYLYEEGHRRIAFVAGSPSSNRTWRDGKPMKSPWWTWASNPDPSFPATCGSKADGPRVRHRKDVSVAKRRDGRERFDGRSVVKGLTSAVFRIPQDISVTGFDKTRLAECSVPSITTVDVNRHLLGQIAADALHALCRASDPQGREYEISAELVVGQSSG